MGLQATAGSPLPPCPSRARGDVVKLAPSCARSGPCPSRAWAAPAGSSTPSSTYRARRVRGCSGLGSGESLDRDPCSSWAWGGGPGQGATTMAFSASIPAGPHPGHGGGPSRVVLGHSRDASVTDRAQTVRLSGLPSPGWWVGGGLPFAAARQRRAERSARRSPWRSDRAGIAERAASRSPAGLGFHHARLPASAVPMEMPHRHAAPEARRWGDPPCSPARMILPMRDRLMVGRRILAPVI